MFAKILSTGDSENQNDHKSVGSRIFRHNQSLGYVSNHIPAITTYVKKRRDTLITACVGRVFKKFYASHLRLIHVSNVHPDEITVMAADRKHTYVGSDKCIYAWRNGQHLVHTYHGHDNDVHLLLPFGEHLIAVDRSNVLKVWEIETEHCYLNIPFNADEFLVTALAHPPTYINKVLLGSQHGVLKIWNLKENRLIYTFSKHNSKVTAIEPAPALDVVAVGYIDGYIILLNLKYDEVLMNFIQDCGSVVQITFRTDGPSIMVTTSNNGYIVLWDLEERKVASQMHGHNDSVTTAKCFPNEPIVLTTSPDNSLKLWIFDQPHNDGRLLKCRAGHIAPPLCIRFHGSIGSSILSSSEDGSLRLFNTITETYNRNLGKATYRRKASKKKNKMNEELKSMPPIIEFTSETTREIEWDNVAAIHSGSLITTTWSFDRKCLGDHKLVPADLKNKTNIESTCITLTHCGNFVIIGYSTGHLERFNIQSGIHRGSYGPPAHICAVRGVATDNLNRFVASGCNEGILKFWHFKENVKEAMTTIKLGNGITLIRHHRESAMLAIALLNFMIVIIDSDSKVIVRKFEGHTAKINDITFSPDSRWLVSAAMDATIKVWDIPSSYMIDHFKLDRPCVSLTMSPTGDFLATAHVNSLGIYLWANKTLFSHISLRSLNPYDDAPIIDISQIFQVPTAVNDKETNTGEEISIKYETPATLSKQLITMSGLPPPRWQNILILELIKQRNKPKKRAKISKQAPFFLPTVTGQDLQFDVSNFLTGNSSKDFGLTRITDLTNFGKCLEESAITASYEKCVDYLKNFSPSMIDFEVCSLHPANGGTYAIIVQFLKTIEHMFEDNINFELAQSYLSVFLRMHGMTLIEIPDVVTEIMRISKVQAKCWRKIERKIMFGTAVVSALRNFTI